MWVSKKLGMEPLDMMCTTIPYVQQGTRQAAKSDPIIFNEIVKFSWHQLLADKYSRPVIVKRAFLSVPSSVRI